MKLSGVLRWLALAMVRVYQIFLGPFMGGGCKFQPSCSAYAYEAIEKFGARHGAWLGMKRLVRCRPFATGGYDPVPEKLHVCERATEDSRCITGPHDGRAVEVLR